jgi:hypothetical protein
MHTLLTNYIHYLLMQITDSRLAPILLFIILYRYYTGTQFEKYKVSL